ncbi:Diaminopimelate epimerase-like protein [Zopfia rhizophila CBS 207.26]|uniref:Diaminopimelate epimerase-like protein n=1 Tax=Zopfia rhizophila CBS 207.26 TaxID=1314779 RepID=A0A6A6ET29_9PEZI|nr:Diaminopimelate epimerase-like protein [Zopfia rhizophila CBS 207.26]
MATSSIQLDFVTVDVFTNTRYKGNPLAIVKVPRSYTLSQDQKQAIAQEFNLSETTFLHERGSANQTITWTVDIFTPSGELPFAGHPTIGTACHAISEFSQGGPGDGTVKAKFKVKAGLIHLEYDSPKNLARASIPHDLHVHAKVWSRADLTQLQPRLAEGSRLGNFQLKENYPIVSVVKGMTFVLIELEDEEALNLVRTTDQSLAIDGLDEGWTDSFAGTYFYVQLADKEDEAKALRTRMIEGTFEDPATGSAASDLAGYLSLQEGRPGQTLKYVITQGVEMGRRSDINIEVVMADDSGIEYIYLVGSAVQVRKQSFSLHR